MNKRTSIFIIVLITVSSITFLVTRHFSEKEIVTVYFPEEIQIDLADYPPRGNENGEITIVELSDFECKHSQALQLTLDTLHENLDGIIKHYFKPRPIYKGRNSRLRSLAVLAAKRQGKYWEMKKELFSFTLDKDQENYKKLLLKNIFEKAQLIGLDIDTYKKDFRSGSVKRELQSIEIEADNYGINAVPMLFINDTMVKGKRSFDNYLDIIENELAKSNN